MTTEAAPHQRLKTVQALKAARDELLAAIDGLPLDRMATPVLDDWTVKDLLTHISSWEELCLADLRRVRLGHTPVLAAFREEDLDRWNSVLMSLRRALPLDQVMFELDDTRRAFVDALGALPDGWFTFGYVPVTCHITAQHDREHAAHIRDWRNQEEIRREPR